MSPSQFFGYGSLVNTATHSYSGLHPATLFGWRRVWVHTSLRPVAYLSVEPADAMIDGLVAHVPDDAWPELEARERAYDKHPIAARLHAGGRDEAAVVFAVPGHHAAPPDTRHPVLLSYIDVVVQGYLRLFGAAGAERFFETTHGWDVPVLMDRAAPRYARHQRLTSAERSWVDEALAKTPATLVHDLG